MNYRKNIIAGSVLLAFAIAYLALSFTIATFQGIGATPLSARFTPQLWGSSLILLSSLLIIRGLRTYKAAKRDMPEKQKRPFKVALRGIWNNHHEVILTFASLFIYIALLKPVGFIITSALFMFALMMILTRKGKRKPLIPAIISVLFAVGLDFVFVELLRVMLPEGILGF